LTLRQSRSTKTLSRQAPFAVHADGNLVFDQHASECRAAELATLIRVEDFRLAVASESVLKGLDAERRFHRDRQPPRQNQAARPIEHDRQTPIPIG